MTGKGPGGWLVGVAIAWLAWLGSEGGARADALVEVELRNGAGEPAEGEVTLESLDGKKVAGCATAQGRCALGQVPGGDYRVRVAPREGKAPKPRRVMVPPDGKVSLIVNTES